MIFRSLFAAALLLSAGNAALAGASDRDAPAGKASVAKPLSLAQKRVADCNDEPVAADPRSHLRADRLAIRSAETRSDNLLRCIRSTSEFYSAQARTARTEQTIFDSTLLTLVTGAIGAAFFHADSDVIGALGLAAGSTTTYRNYYDPGRERRSYLKAAQSLQCVAGASTVISLQNPDQLAILRQQLRSRKYKLIYAFALAGQHTPAEIEAEQAAITAADSAINALTTEITAYLHGPADLSRQLLAVNSYVDVQESRDYVDTAKVQQTIQAGITTATQGAAAAIEAQVKLQSAITSAAKVQAGGDASTSDQATALVRAEAASEDGQPPAAADSAAKKDSDTGKDFKKQIALLNALSQMAIDETADRPYHEISVQVGSCTAGMES